MKRRDFLKLSSMASLAFSINGLPIKAFGEGKFAEALLKTRASNGNILVLIQLSGGNDGLNMVIPLDKYAELTNGRSNILIPSANVLTLNGQPNTGLHPSMTGLQNMYNTGKVNIVQAVSYPNPNFSHFRSNDIWETASDSGVFLNTGWVGRLIDNQFPGAPQAYPTANFLSPLAIQIGSTVSTTLTGANGLNGIALSSISNFYNIVNGVVDPAPNTPAGNELTFIRFISQQTQAYTQVIQNAAGLGSNLATYPSGNNLANQLKIVAQLISGGLQTPVYIVSMGGFDTHDNQVDTTNTIYGQHSQLMQQLSDAIAAFQNDLELMGKDDIVSGCTISEFGRRVKSNASVGTDHGSGAPLIVFGSMVNPTVIGTSPNLPANPTVNDNVPMQHDFRQVYASILQDWLGMSVADAESVLNGVQYQTLPIFKTLPNDVGEITEPVSTISLEQNFPNPFINHTTIRFVSDGGFVNITLYDDMGRRIRTLYENEVPAGTFEVNVDRAGLATGHYFYQMTHGTKQFTKKMLVVN
ncbi:MAG: DUF1501 domain-containing protein [Chitinophagaceae bacterium]|nr:DUF1501 domain-containing protein [Chitinophagaceae bacterium]